MAEAAPWTPFGDVAARLPAERPGVRLAVAATPAAWLLQADPSDRGWRDAIAKRLGVAPPQDVGGVAEVGARRLLALGSDVWLLLADSADAADIAAGLTAIDGGFGHAAAVEQTDARAWLQLEGPAAAATLARLATFDLALAAFPPGTARNARIGPIHCVVVRRAEGAFLLGAPVSTAEYFALQLREALPAA